MVSEAVSRSPPSSVMSGTSSALATLSRTRAPRQGMSDRVGDGDGDADPVGALLPPGWDAGGDVVGPPPAGAEVVGPGVGVADGLGVGEGEAEGVGVGSSPTPSSLPTPSTMVLTPFLMSSRTDG